MIERNKKILIISIIIIIIGYFGYQSLSKNTSDENNVSEQKTEKEIVVEGLASKYNALTNWDEDISYTLQLQELVESDDLVLFTGYIDDVFKENDQYFISFITDYFIYPQIRFVLKVDPERVSQALEVIEEDPLYLQIFGGYAVVADVSEIKKINLQISGYPSGTEDVSIECDPSKIYVATGDCIDFVYIPEGSDRE
ncbi:MAG: hypothetical protein WC302_02560 [Candidatus Paceibacterota bacterium]|jgi:hypothetical protein